MAKVPEVVDKFIKLFQKLQKKEAPVASQEGADET